MPVPAHALPRVPARALVVVTCMDARLDPLAILDLELGDAHMLRNAGARATTDVIDSVKLSHEWAGTTRVVVVGHTDCAAHQGDDEAATATVRATVAALTAELPAMEVNGVFYDLHTGELAPLA